MTCPPAYRIRLRGQMSASEIDAISPIQVSDVRPAALSTTFTICTDQSGLIGLLRSLHNRGIQILLVQAETETPL